MSTNRPSAEARRVHVHYWPLRLNAAWAISPNRDLPTSTVGHSALALPLQRRSVDEMDYAPPQRLRDSHLVRASKPGLPEVIFCTCLISGSSHLREGG